ncbi:MAG: hypothetical protein ABJG88_07440, partial [Litorimonas sp.]
VGFAPLNAVKSWHQLRTAEVIARTKAMFENAKELEDYKLGLRHSLVELTSIKCSHRVEFSHDISLSIRLWKVRKLGLRD